MSAAPAAAEPALEALRGLLRDPRAPISASSVRRAGDVHIADSLSGLELEPLEEARRLADLGSGAGLPGLVLAAGRPEARFDLIESVGRKCEFLREAIERMALGNAAVVCERSEDWAGGEGP